jgi:hypothetical protein
VSTVQILLALAGAGLLLAAGAFTLTSSLTGGIRRQVEHEHAFTEPTH